MTALLTKNSKIAKSGKSTGLRVYNFGIPALRSATGMVTCPMAGTCATGCYAQAGTYVWSNVAPAYEYRLQVTQAPDFVAIMADEVARRKADVVRVHDSGDFYSVSYMLAWFAVAESHPSVRFYAYTKMVGMVKRLAAQGRVPPNFTIIYSYGGKQDHLIDPTCDRHSAVFATAEAAASAGYANAMQNDLVAIGDNHRVGLVYHGSKAKQWEAGT